MQEAEAKRELEYKIFDNIAKEMEIMNKEEEILEYFFFKIKCNFICFFNNFGEKVHRPKARKRREVWNSYKFFHQSFIKTFVICTVYL